MGYQDNKAFPGSGMKKYFSSNKDLYPSGGIPIRTNFSTGGNKQMKQHAEHHSAKHMAHMKSSMQKGDSFKTAHNKAMDRVGAKSGGGKDKGIQSATKNMRKDKPCTGKKFGSKTCPPGTKRYNLAKTFRAMNKKKS